MKKDKLVKSTSGAPRSGTVVLKFKLKNWVLFGGGVIFIVLGFYLLHLGSMTVAPILLFLGYCVLIPVSIILK